MKKKKKKYVKPLISSEKVFETATLGCGKCYSASTPVYNQACVSVRYAS